MLGTFYQNELQRVQIPRDTLFVVDKIIAQKTVGGERWVKVHFFDWPKKYDRWIKQRDLVRTSSGEQIAPDIYTHKKKNNNNIK